MILRVADRAGIGRLPALRRAASGAPVVEIDGASLANPGERLPFVDASFDAAVAVHSLEAVPNRSWALTELRRVLRSDGQLLLAVWGPLEDNPAFSALGDSLRRRGGVGAEAAVRWLSSLSDPDDLRAFLRVTDFDHLRVTRQRGNVELSAVLDLRGWLFARSPIGAAMRALPSEAREGVISDLLGAFEGSAHRIPFSRDVHTAVARAAA